MLTCQNCREDFELHETSGAAGVMADGQYVGRCPACGYLHAWGNELPPAKYSQREVQNLVATLELAGDNLCQRVVDLLWQTGWLPAKEFNQ
jgi:hypothetical protein